MATPRRSDGVQVSTAVAGAASRDDDRSTNGQRQLIGYVGLLMPLFLILLSQARDGMERWRNLDSISAHYYSGASAVFVGMLVALALFLLPYRGYDNQYNWADRWAARVAALAALVVALFPTAAPQGVQALSWWTQTTGILHYAAAVVLFSAFAVFALWLFRLKARGEAAAPDKLWRNRVYLLSGVVIVASMLWAGYNGYHGRPIFWPESLALFAFSVSWLVKGYALGTLAGAARALLRPRGTAGKRD
jgi:hypothetical protein